MHLRVHKKKTSFVSATSSMIHKWIWWELLRLSLLLETTKSGKGSQQKVCFFSWYVFMTMHQNSLMFFHWKLSKISKHNAGFSFGHTEIIRPFFLTINDTLKSEYSKRNFRKFVLKSFATQVMPCFSLSANYMVTNWHYFEKGLLSSP